MEKKFLLPNTNRYKANLHCHTTCSDGKITPEDMKAAYKARGYSVVAFTDHEYIVNHQELNDGDFIAITAYEYSINEEPHGARREWNDLRCCHLNFYAKDPHMDKHVCFHPKYVWGPGKAVADTLAYVGPLYERDYADIQHVIDCAREAGYLVCFNHPYWSLQPQEDYFHLKGLFAMEIYNTGCWDISGHSLYDYNLLAEYNPSVAPVAADDNHNHSGNIENSDSFGGYTMIYTDDFSYTGILCAMERQDFYASTGIDFGELSVTGDVLHVECTSCTNIMVYFGGRRWTQQTASDGIEKADFKIPADAKYIRVICLDKRNGAYAATKTYLL